MSSTSTPAVLFRRPRLRVRSGCTTCRLRRKKCDEAKPVCNACRRLSFICVWQNEQNDSDLSSALSTFRRRPVLANSQSPTRLSLSAFQDNICISFLLDNLFKGLNDPIDQRDHEDTFTVKIQMQYINDDSSKSWRSLRAMALVYFGRNHDDPISTRAGFAEHGEALKVINACVVRPDNTDNGDVVSAIAIAGLFTMMIPEYAGAWLSHAAGMASIVAALGPETFQTTQMLRILETNRFVMIAAASVLKSPTFFSSETWKSTPWQFHPKNSFQQLLDLYSDQPNIDELFVKLKNSETEDLEPVKAELLTRAIRLLRQLHTWRLSIEEKVQADMRQFLVTSDSPRDAGIQRIAVGFGKLRTAFQIAVFNLMLTVVCGYLASPHFAHIGASDKGWADYQPTEESEASEASKETDAVGSDEQDLQASVLPFKDPLQRAIRASEEIAQLLPYGTTGENLGAGSLYLFAPATIAFHFFLAFDQTKAVWFGKMLKKLGSVWESLGTRGVQDIRKSSEAIPTRRLSEAAQHSRISEY